MKLLRRNDEQSSGRGGMSIEEMRQLNALKLMEELMKKQSLSDGRDSQLHPKRLLCFINKSKKDEYPEERRDQSPWRSRSIMDSKTRRKKGDISALCTDYNDLRKKLRQRPHAPTSKKTPIEHPIASSTSTASSSIDAPLRNFDRGAKKKVNSNIHYSNENRALHRHQRSLMDDNISVQSEQSDLKAKWNPNKSTPHRPRTSKSSRSKNSDRSRSSQSRSHGSHSHQSSSRKSYREKEIPSRSKSMSSEYTEHTLPISVVDKKIRQTATMSTMTSKSSYTTFDDESVILSPRGANDRVERQPSRVNLSLGCSPVTPYATPQPKSRNYSSRNLGKVDVRHNDLGVIKEDYDYTSSSDSFSSYSSSYSSGSYSDYSGSGLTEYYDDPSVFYERSHESESISKGRMNRTEKTNASAASGQRSTSRGDDGRDGRISTMIYEDEKKRDDRYKYYYP